METTNKDTSKEDLVLQGLIKDAIAKELSGAEIFVTVKGGVVTLDGDVASVGVKRLAEQIARDTAGVTEVRNQIEAEGPGGAVGLVMNQDVNPLGTSDPLSEASNMGDPSIHHPTTSDPTETVDVNQDGPTGMEGGGEPVSFAPVEGVPAVVPMTGSGMSVMDAGAVDAMKVSGSELDDEAIGRMIMEGMTVIDSNGLEIGHVKVVRSTDFLLARPLFSRDLYVPYFQCEMDGDRVRVKVAKEEIKDQGWAHP